MTKNPFDPSEMFKGGSADAMSKFFDPMSLMKSLQEASKDLPGLSGFAETHQRNVEALAEANKAAMAGYKDMLEKQMQIFQSVTEPAQQMLKGAGDPAAIQASTAAWNKAVEEALGLMQSMAEAAQAANAQAFEKVNEQAASLMRKPR